MAQQINLCSPFLLTQKRYFSAQTMLLSLAALLLTGAAVAAYWVLSLNSSSEALTKSLAAQSLELGKLQAELQPAKARAAAAAAALVQELKTRRAELAQSEMLYEELQRGLLRPGWGHSARLELVARSIPAQVWLTDVKADEVRLDVTGFTIEPAALNQWVAKLAASPLLQGQKLSTVKVEHTAVAGGKNASPPIWSFNLVSALAKPLVKVEVKP